jgi:hypothetical protein
VNKRKGAGGCAGGRLAVRDVAWQEVEGRGCAGRRDGGGGVQRKEVGLVCVHGEEAGWDVCRGEVGMG